MLGLSLAAALLLCAMIGLSLGLLGGGGSILAVPVLVYVAGLEVHTAIPVSLAIVGATALVGALSHLARGRVSLKAAAWFGGAGLLAAPLGALATPLVSGRTLLTLFASLLLVVGVSMRRSREAPAGARVPSHPLPLMGTGAGVGLLTGFLGVGGGFLIVPALTLLAGLPMDRAVGTSLAVIAATSGSGLLAHAGVATLPVLPTAAFTLAAVAGALAGGRLAGRLRAERLRRVFAAFVILVGLVLLARNALAG